MDLRKILLVAESSAQFLPKLSQSDVDLPLEREMTGCRPLPEDTDNSEHDDHRDGEVQESRRQTEYEREQDNRDAEAVVKARAAAESITSGVERATVGKPDLLGDLRP